MDDNHVNQLKGLAANKSEGRDPAQTRFHGWAFLVREGDKTEKFSTQKKRRVKKKGGEWKQTDIQVGAFFASDNLSKLTVRRTRQCNAVKSKREGLGGKKKKITASP